MREIKFRAWDTWRNKMETDLQCYASFQNDGGVNCFNGFRDNILMQFIGLKDKSKKEIYKDDLLQDDENRLFQVIEDNRIGKTGYIMSCVKNKSEIDHIEIGSCYDFWSWVCPENSLQVVGNIYENKELLKNEKS